MTDGNKGLHFPIFANFVYLIYSILYIQAIKNNSNSVVQFYYKARKKYRLSDFVITTIVSNVEYLIYSILYILGYKKNNSKSVVQFYYKARKNTDFLILLSQPQSVKEKDHYQLLCMSVYVQSNQDSTFYSILHNQIELHTYNVHVYNT